MESPLSYIPTDRRHALAEGVDLPRRTTGAALFADISGFTPLTEALVAALGSAHGAEELSLHLNGIYDALVAQVDDYRGSVLAFSGDAITCWFDASGDGGWAASRERPTAAQRAVACALAMQAAMCHVATITMPGESELSLAVKVAVAVGPVARFVVGDPTIQTIDALAGETLQRLAAAEHHAHRGDVVLDEAAVAALAEPENIVEWRDDGDSGERFAVVTALSVVVPPDPWSELPLDRLPDAVVRPWLLPPVASRLSAGLGEFLTELRPAVSLFLRFGGIDYDDDPHAGAKLDEFVRATQGTLGRFESYLLQLTIGDKGSYLNAAFGAPIAHEDDAVRAVTAALELRDRRSDSLGAVHIGISQGRMRTGAYGATTRRTYGVLGDEVNVAARLMQLAPANTVLVDPSVRRATLDAFVWADVEPIQVKGKAQPVRASRLASARDRRSTHVSEPRYALPMVGRQRELAEILARLDLVASGTGQVVAVTGDAGMGKSRLIAEVIAQARSRSIVCYGGECQSYGLNASYLVWNSIFRSFFNLERTMAADEQIATLGRQLATTDPVLVARLPLLAAVLNIPIPDNELTVTFDAKLRKESLEALLVDCLRARARQHPMLLILEDCHWLDPLSHDLLEVLARAVVDLPVMIVVAHRPTQAPWLDVPRVSQLLHYMEVRLGDLPEREIAALVRAKAQQLFGGEVGTPSEAFVAEVGRRAEGNPFYIEELLNFLKDRRIGALEPEVVENMQLSDSLHSLILGRIDQLTQDQRTALMVASVIGRRFGVAMLRGIYESTAVQDRLLSDLTALAEMELTVLERPEPELTYEFKHVLTQEVAYGTLPYATRAVLHEQIGQHIEANYPNVGEQHLDLLAYHYDRSTNIGKRREYLIKAGHAARASFANLSAIDYFQRALPLFDGAERVDTLLALGEVQELEGEWLAAEASMTEAGVIAEQCQDVSARARAALALGVLERKRGRYDSASSLLTNACMSFEALDDIGGASRCHSELSEVAHLQGNYAEARARCNDSLALADRVGDPVARRAARAHALNGAGTVAARQGDYEAGQAFYDESLAIRRDLADTPGEATLLNNLGVIARFRQDLVEARRLNDESIALFRMLGDRWALGQLLNNQACIAADQGDFAEARTLLAESLTIRRQLGDRAGLALSLNTLADVVIDEGDHADSVPLLDESLDIYRSLGDATAAIYVIEDYAGVAAAQGQHARAVRLASFASARRELLGAPLSPAEEARVARMIASAHGALDTATAAQCVLEGRDLGLANALDELLASS